MSQPSDAQPETRLGEIVDARYRIVAHLGAGGMAAVFRAEHLHNGSIVAIKVLHKEYSNHAEASARFQREALAARRIQHPNVVAVMDFGKLPDGCLYMVLEYIRGEDLCIVLHREKPLPAARAVKIALQVAHALVSAHRAGIVHRDLKPENIMLVERAGDPDFVKVVDFGIAKVAMQRGPALTALGSVFGTPEYMAPEQARGATVDHRTDLYALGIVLYEMLTGATPFADDQFATVIMSQITKPPPPLPASVDRELAALVMQLLAKQPPDRVQSAEALLERLRTILDRLAPGHPALASLPGTGAMPSAPRPPVAASPPNPAPQRAAGSAVVAIPAVPVMPLVPSGTQGAPAPLGGFSPVAPVVTAAALPPLPSPPPAPLPGQSWGQAPAVPGVPSPGWATAAGPLAQPSPSPQAPLSPAAPAPAANNKATLIGCGLGALVLIVVAFLLARMILAML